MLKEPTYLEDHQVDESLDSELRGLLSTCFVNGDAAEVFRCQRFFKDKPQHRYMRWHQGQLIAHVAVHEKQVLIDGVSKPICGIAEVCVAEDYRGKGLVKELLAEIHQQRAEAGDEFSVLFGDTEVYSSSGYQGVGNMSCSFDGESWVKVDHVMVKSLNQEWPNQPVKLIGIPF
ncbi:GNAT family N-acetyltransferase [Vibrio maerlii]|uniref:GNAT family N-acetyltransferase n=1 Tax=Vibrio maerlii TaxID=2231648 RepID=UPI000E3CFC1E|nr:GNAT family N-acetyltransferase [Vibrio maerlii]